MKNGQPILPSKPKAPTMTVGINNTADKRIKSAMRTIQNAVLKMLNDIPKSRVTAPQSGIIGNADQPYLYQVTPQILGRIPDEIGIIIEDSLLESGAVDWYMYQAVDKAEETGTAAEVVNIQAQTVPTEYPVTIQSAMLAAPHIARVELARNRVFNEMQGLSAEMKTNLSRVLSNGMANGDSPRLIARQIYNQIGLPEWNDGGDKASYARALRIARTEINEAHRKAREGERDVARNMGIMMGVMHLSALKANTRRWHARRHGWTGTEQEEKEWYSKDGNSIQCQCSVIGIVLNKDGSIRSDKFKDKVEKQKVTYEKVYAIKDE
jgi:hypothetical protein